MITCAVCGHENPGTNRFCGECAAPLVAAPPGAEVRKTVTIVFCDLVGSTAMGETLDPEHLRLVTQRYFDEMRIAIERHGGTVEKFIGDAVMAVFGVPHVHEDDALRAVRAAGDMRDVLTALNAELDRDHGVSLACRIGVNTGEVVAGAGDAVVVGDTVNVAARLEQAASSGEILLGAETYGLVRDAIVAEPVEALDLKGKTLPVPAHRLIQVTPGAAGFARHLDAPMVGRERELALLRSAFDRTVSDQACQLFTILGVGGVGKSRLMAAFVDELGERATVLRGRCLPYGEGITFYPLAEALIEIADLREADTPEAARAKLEALAGSGDAAGRVAELVGQAIGLGGESAPDETFWAIRSLLEQLAVDRPLVFSIDDLQWAEPTFLDLVGHVADFARDAPILLACMARPELLDDHPAWAGGKLNATSILVEALGPEECGTLVANLLADDSVDAAVRTRIADAAEGHPLYAEEITGLLVDEGRLALKEGRWVATSDLSDVPVPPTISALLAARLDRLPAGERRLLDLASVMGQIFYPAAVRSLAVDDEDFRAELDALVRRQFVRQERSDLAETDAMAFRHLLIRDAAYEAVPKSARAEWHERFAAWLDGAGGSLGEQDEIVGYHLEKAYRYRLELGAAGERERRLADAAGRRLATAGEQAAARSDHAAATNLLTRACALLAPDDPLRIEILPDLGSAYIEAGGDWEGGRAIFDEAAERATAGGDERLRMHAVIMRWLGSAASAEFTVGAETDAHHALDVFEAAGDERGLSRAWQLLSEVRFINGELGNAERDLGPALIHARNAGDLAEQIAIYSRIGTLLARGPTPVGKAIRRAEAILAETAGNRTIAGVMYHPLAHMKARQGEFAEATRLATLCRDIHRDNGSMWSYWVYAEMLWDIEMLAGRPAEATEILTEAYEQIERMGETFGLLSAWLAESLYAVGRFDEAERRAEAAVETLDDQGRAAGQGALARVRARQGRFEEAEALAREGVAYFAHTDYSTDRTWVLMDLAEVLRLAGRSDEAIATLREALALFEQREDAVSAAHTRELIDRLAASTA